ncbi:SdpI family protein [Candidatus Soleaferrea massiliensis]|uniref:SdpI family protein n=1 Tax=Candidatus Soleaferrea massiliensis TaxID=1470354 RepID=UPI00058D3AF4|nr:SdpI family protein [Candidatus Soleaferrea massiliensis]
MIMYETWVIFLMMYLLPLVMILLGFLLKLFPPKYDNAIFGFRSERSLSSKEMWRYAQQSFAKKSLLAGAIILVALMFVNMLWPLHQPILNITAVTVSVIALVVIYVWVELELKKKMK